jgi:hypothetical protein
VKDATQDEYDLVLAIRRIRKALKTTVYPLWVAGHPKPADTRGEQARNADAHKLAVERLRNGGTDTIPLDLGVGQSVVSVLYKNKIITSGLPQQILANLYYIRLKEKLQRDNNWGLISSFH